MRTQSLNFSERKKENPATATTPNPSTYGNQLKSITAMVNTTIDHRTMGVRDKEERRQKKRMRMRKRRKSRRNSRGRINGRRNRKEERGQEQQVREEEVESRRMSSIRRSKRKGEEE